MADPAVKPPETHKPAAAVKPGRYDLVNPTRARRVIHDGIAGIQRAITVEPGAILRDVEMHPDVAKELKARTRVRGKENSDLHVYLAGQAPDPSKINENADEDEDDGE